MTLTLGTPIDFISDTSFELNVAGQDPVGVVVSSNSDQRSEVLVWCVISWSRRLKDVNNKDVRVEIGQRPCGFNTVYFPLPDYNKSTDKVRLLFPNSYNYAGISGEYRIDLL